MDRVAGQLELWLLSANAAGAPASAAMAATAAAATARVLTTAHRDRSRAHDRPAAARMAAALPWRSYMVTVVPLAVKVTFVPTFSGARDRRGAALARIARDAEALAAALAEEPAAGARP